MAESELHALDASDVASTIAQQTQQDQASQPSSSRDPVLDENENEPLLRDADDVHSDEGKDEMFKSVLKKIDRTIIPLLFITYMLNFMDKAILSSAAVFGLREDNVRKFPSFSHVDRYLHAAARCRILKARSTAG